MALNGILTAFATAVPSAEPQVDSKNAEQKTPLQGPFPPLQLYFKKPLATTSICARKNPTQLMNRFCKAGDYFMASALRSSESFRDLLPFTQDLQFADQKAVVLYPGSGFHIAPIAELGEALLKQHNLKEVEFIYTEIKGELDLRLLKRALQNLAKNKVGWSTGSSYRIRSNLEITHEVAKMGPPFEEVLEINTPSGLITIHYKNALSGGEYYLDEDLQRANIVVVHDLTQPTDEGREGNEKFVRGLVANKKDRHNFLILSEDFTRSPKGWGNHVYPSKDLGEIHFTQNPFGCGWAHVEEIRGALQLRPFLEEEPVDIASLGLISPNILEMQSLGYRLWIDPETKTLRMRVATYDGLLESKPLIRAELYISESQGEWESMPERFAKVLAKRLRIQEKISVRPKHYVAPSGEYSYFLSSFDVPTSLYDPRIFNLVSAPTKVKYDIDDERSYVSHEFAEPGYRRAMILKPNL